MSGRAFEDLNKARVHSAKQFTQVMNQVEFGFNWTYADDRDIAYFSSGRLPIRPASVDLGLPTNGDGHFEWRGFQPGKAHPQAIDPSGGVIVNWNNKPARGFAAADDHWSYGSLQRVQLLSRRLAGSEVHAGLRGRRDEPRGDQDFRGSVLPSIAAVLAGTTAPSARDGQMLELLEAGARRAGAGSTWTSTASSTTRARRSWTPAGRGSPAR